MADNPLRSKYTQFENIWAQVSQICRDKYNIKTGRNAEFVCEIIFSEFIGKNSFSYAECGVYQGTTFFPVYHFCDLIFSDVDFFALDTFSGFPKNSISEYDECSQFKWLYQKGKITQEHLMASEKRCARLKHKEHLGQDYFKNGARLFNERKEGKKNITTIISPFSKLDSVDGLKEKKFDLVFLDCDLYLSYKLCLDFFKKKTGIFILDEYYSLKYPGARIACNEFVQKDRDWIFFHKFESEPYFERWGIKKVIS